MTKDSSVKLDRRVTVLLGIACVLMIIAAVVSAYLGFNLVSNYRTSLANGRFVSTDYLSLILGLLNLAAFGLDLFAAMLLLLRKHIGLAVILIGIVLAFGLAAPLISNFMDTSQMLNPSFDIPTLTNMATAFATTGLYGLIYGSSMIAFSIPAIIITRLNYKKLQTNNVRWRTLPFMASGVLVIVASLISAYSGIETLYNYFAYMLTHNVPGYVGPLSLGLLNLGAFGAGLFGGTLLLLKKRVGLAVILVGLMLACMLAISGYIPPDNLLLGSSTIVISVAALILAGLNHRTLKQDALKMELKV